MSVKENDPIGRNPIPELYPDSKPEPNPIIMASPRYAVYYTPEADESLADFGKTWLGRCVRSNRAIRQPVVADIDTRRFYQITDSPRRYGFHGTLKPPFRLKTGYTSEDLQKFAKAFASCQKPFALPPLIPAILDGFLALIPKNRSRELINLASACVREFDPFRAPPTPEELRKRRLCGLTSSQECHLQQWGYPYVMSDFRFHLTLTQRLENGKTRRLLLDEIKKRTAVCFKTPLWINSLCIFKQNRLDEPFILKRRFRFGQKKEVHQIEAYFLGNHRFLTMHSIDWNKGSRAQGSKESRDKMTLSHLVGK